MIFSFSSSVCTVPFILFLLCAYGCYGQDVGNTLTIEVDHIRKISGKIHAGLFANAEDYRQKKNPVRKGVYTVEDHKMIITYHDVPAGEYAVLLFHDVNDNGENDKNVLGAPKEPFGFSNNVVLRFGLPPFSKTKFRIEKETEHIVIHLQTMEKHWNIGAAAVTTVTPYVGGKVRVLPFPTVVYRGEHFDIFGLAARYHLYRDKHWDFSVIGRANLNGYKSKDDPYLEGLGDRKYTAEVGGEISYRFYKRYVLSANWYGDVLNVSHGMQGSFNAGVDLGTRKWRLTPSIALEWQNRNYGDYYYGVQEKNSTSQRPEYHLGYALNPAFSCSSLHFVGDTWMFYVNGRVSYLDKDIRNSPIVDRSFLYTFICGFVYHF